MIWLSSTGLTLVSPGWLWSTWRASWLPAANWWCWTGRRSVPTSPSQHQSTPCSWASFYRTGELQYSGGQGSGTALTDSAGGGQLGKMQLEVVGLRMEVVEEEWPVTNEYPQPVRSTSSQWWSCVFEISHDPRFILTGFITMFVWGWWAKISCHIACTNIVQVVHAPGQLYYWPGCTS